MNEQDLLQAALDAFRNGDEKAANDNLKAAAEFSLLRQTNSVPPDATNVIPSIIQGDIAATGPTVADIQGENQQDMTFEEALALAQAQQQQTAAAGQPEVMTIPGFGTITRVPEFGGSVLQQFGRGDILGQATGTNGNEQIRNLFGSYENLLGSFDTQRTETEDLLNRTRAGEFDSRFSNPAFQKVRVARNFEEAQRIREEGFIPIAARDAELIRQIGEEQARALMAEAQQSVDLRGREGRHASLQQASAALGNAIASALTGTAIGGEQNTRLGGLAQQARSNILQSVENRRLANAQARDINAKSRIDAMLANTEAAQQLQNLMVQDASNSFRLRFEEESRLQNRLQELADRRATMEANRPAFLSSLVQLASMNNQPGSAQFIQDRASTDRFSMGIKNRSEVSVLTAAQLAQEAQKVAQRAAETGRGFFSLDEELADAEIKNLIETYNEFNNLTDPTLRQNAGQIIPEVIRIREEVLKDIEPMLAQLRSSGIIGIDKDGNYFPASANVEANDSFVGFTKDFGEIGTERINALNALVNKFGGPNADPASLRPGSNNSTLDVNMSASQRAANLVSQLN